MTVVSALRPLVTVLEAGDEPGLVADEALHEAKGIDFLQGEALLVQRDLAHIAVRKPILRLEISHLRGYHIRSRELLRQQRRIAECQHLPWRYCDHRAVQTMCFLGAAKVVVDICLNATKLRRLADHPAVGVVAEGGGGGIRILDAGEVNAGVTQVGGTARGIDDARNTLARILKPRDEADGIGDT